MIANSHGQNLQDHCIAVSKTAEALAKYNQLNDPEFSIDLIGPEFSIDLIEIVRLAGLYHDIGKCIKHFQSYIQKRSKTVQNQSPECEENDDNDIEFDQYPEHNYKMPMHHEISWAFLNKYLPNNHNAHFVLDAIYWHHPQPTMDNGYYYESDNEILANITDKDKKDILEFYCKLNEDNSPEHNETQTAINLHTQVPRRIHMVSKTEDISNTRYFTIRNLVKSCDQFISSLNKDTVHNIATGEKNIDIIIQDNFNLSSQKQPITPKEYRNERFDKQKKYAEACNTTGTHILPMPCGYGKTLIALQCIQKYDQRAIIVCPRNDIVHSTYKQIIKEIEQLQLKYSVSYSLTGGKIKNSYNTKSQTPFTTDITITNIDSILNPVYTPKNADQIISRIFCPTIIFDEFHEFTFTSDQDTHSVVLASFVDLMRCRHNFLTNARTILLSGTQSNINSLWDINESNTSNIIERGSPIHNNLYHVKIIQNHDELPNKIENNTLTAHSSIANSQREYSNRNYYLNVHSKFTDKDREQNDTKIQNIFGKDGKNNGQYNVSSAMILQAAKDISFQNHISTIISPESNLQFLGRINRWGEYSNSNVTFINLDFSDSSKIIKSEKSTIKTIYNLKLNELWSKFLLEHINNNNNKLTLKKFYEIYDKFYENYKTKIIPIYQTIYTNELRLLSTEFKYQKRKSKKPNTSFKTSCKNIRNVNRKTYWIIAKHQNNQNKWIDAPIEDHRLFVNKSGNMTINSKDLYDFFHNEFNNFCKTIKSLSKDDFPDWEKWYSSNKNLRNRIHIIVQNPSTPFPDIYRIYNSKIGLHNPEKLNPS